LAFKRREYIPRTDTVLAMFKVFTKSTQNGATYIETAIGLPILILFIIGIIDGSRLMARYARLTYVTAEVTRSVAVVVGRNNLGLATCPEIKTAADLAIDQYFIDHPGQNIGFTQLDTEVVQSSPYPTVRIRFTSGGDCIFCRIIPGGVTLTNSSVLVLEDDDFAC